MGKGSSTTVGYRYRHALFDVWAQFADKMHRYLAGGKNTGAPLVEANTVTQIYQPDLWGGDKAEGGVVGPLHVMFGRDDQPLNGTLGSILGGKQTGHRGFFSTFFSGVFGSYIPNPKTRAVLLERLHHGWPGNEAWYPETVAIPLGAETEHVVVVPVSPDVVLDAMGSSPDGTGEGFDFTVPAGATIIVELGPSSPAWSYTPSDDYNLSSFPRTWTNRFGLRNNGTGTVGLFWLDTYLTAPEAHAAHVGEQVEFVVPEAGSYRLFLYDAVVDDNRGVASYRVSYSYTYVGAAINAMNPAHIIRYVLTVKKGIPDAMLSEASFTYAADVLFAEGFGLCEVFDPDKETPEDFIQRICDIIGACCTQSRADGLIYLDLLRNDYVKEDLPKITDDDILDWLDEMAVPTEVTNSVQIGWRDVLIDGGLDRITPPAKALGHIRTHGREQNLVIDLRGIPFEAIALRVCKRELDARSKPLHRLTLSTHRRHISMRPGLPMLIDCPKFGIADMVVRVGQIDIGSPTDEKMQWVFLQDVFDLPLTTALDPTTIYDPDLSPSAPSITLAQEAPYVALLTILGPTVVAEVDESVGYLMTGASAPESGFNYGVYTRLSTEPYEQRSTEDFAPSAVATDGVAPLTTTVQLESPRLLERVVVGMWGVWENEIIRVDGISDDLVLSMGRGCLDTVPQPHDPGTIILFLSTWYGTDGREYTVGEELSVKLPVQRGGESEALADVTELDVVFAQRQFRPYVPGGLLLNDLPFYDSGAVTTPPGGGGGGPTTPTTPPATSPGGGPASPVPGPNGGFPDDAPYPIPLPSVGGDVIDDGDFTDPASLAGWRDRLGNPLASDWEVTAGKAQYSGSAGTAYGYAWRMSISPQPFPRYSITVTAKVQTTGGQVARVGVAWGTNTSIEPGSEVPNNIEADLAAPYLTETTVSYTWELQRQFEFITAFLYYGHVNFMPVVQFAELDGAPEVGTVDDATMVIAEVPVPTTPIALDHLDFDTGLIDWDLWPDPSNPYAATVTAAGGELSMSPTHELAKFANAYCVAPIDAAVADAVGKYIVIEAEVWCDDPSVDLRGRTSGGAHMFLATKTVTDGYAKNSVYVALRGDWTVRRWWYRINAVPTGSLLSCHVCSQMKCELGYSVKVRNIAAAITDSVMD